MSANTSFYVYFHFFVHISFKSNLTYQILGWNDRNHKAFPTSPRWLWWDKYFCCDDWKPKVCLSDTETALRETIWAKNGLNICSRPKFSLCSIYPKFTVSDNYSQHPYNHSTYYDFFRNEFKKKWYTNLPSPLAISVDKKGLILKGLIRCKRGRAWFPTQK